MSWREGRKRCIPAAVLLLLGIVAAHPAAGQITFGSPGDPPRVALGGGAFDAIVNTKKPGSATIGLAMSEYRFGDVWWIISPFVGVFGTGQGAYYTYFGIGFDINFLRNLVLTPSSSFGYFGPGHGINLGSQWEFKSGVELAYRFADERRLGVGFYHMSNAGIGKTDPGEEMVTAVFTVPFR